MENERTTREMFRRSGLTIVPEWALASGLALAVGQAAHHFGVHGGEVPVLLALPLAWAGGRTLQWACHTRIVEDGGNLVVRRGALIRQREVIDLDTVDRVEPETSFLAKMLGAGHVTFQAANAEGVRQRYRWRWMGKNERLCEILRAGGRLPIGRPSRWRQVGYATVRLAHRFRAELIAGWYVARKTANRLRGHWFAEDYGRFLAFCHHLLRNRDGGRAWPPPRTPAAVERIWMDVLRRAHVVVDAPNERGWSVTGTVSSLGDIRRRIGEEELHRAVRRLDSAMIRQRQAA